MPQVPCNRTNPHLVVPHLIVRTPLPTGTEVVQMHHIDEVKDLIACNKGRIEALEGRCDAIETTLGEHDTRISLLEVLKDLDVPGMIIPFAGTTAPAGWLMCDGSSYPVAGYSRLHDLIGYTYGGSADNFNVPDLRKKFVRGHDSTLGTLGDSFDPRTARPASETSMPVSSGGAVAHKHSIVGTDLQTAGGHAHTVTIANADATHIHGSTMPPDHVNGSTGSGGTHSHTASDAADHQHQLGSGGTPVIACRRTDLEAVLNVFAPASAWPGYGTLSLDAADWDGHTPAYLAAYFAGDNPPGVGLPYNSNIWKSSENGSHTHSIDTATNHNHSIASASANHGHSVSSVSSAPAHTHTGETSNATPTAHTHTVSKDAGWDTETRPQGILQNFIIRW